MRIVLALALLGAASTASAAEEASLKVGDPAPQFVLKTLNPELSGRPTFVLRDHVGDQSKKKAKAVVLNFAASYCAPCKEELPELDALAPKLAAAGVELAVVVVDTDAEGIAEMKALTVDTLKLRFPVLSDRFGVLGRRYGAHVLPLTVVVGPDATVRYVSSGFKPDSLPKLLAHLGL